MATTYYLSTTGNARSGRRTRARAATRAAAVIECAAPGGAAQRRTTCDVDADVHAAHASRGCATLNGGSKFRVTRFRFLGSLRITNLTRRKGRVYGRTVRCCHPTWSKAQSLGGLWYWARTSSAPALRKIDMSTPINANASIVQCSEGIDVRACTPGCLRARVLGRACVGGVCRDHVYSPPIRAGLHRDRRGDGVRLYRLRGEHPGCDDLAGAVATPSSGSVGTVNGDADAFAYIGAGDSPRGTRPRGAGSTSDRRSTCAGLYERFVPDNSVSLAAVAARRDAREPHARQPPSVVVRFVLASCYKGVKSKTSRILIHSSRVKSRL